MATPPLAARTRVPPESLQTVPSEHRPCDGYERVGLTADEERLAAQPQVLGRTFKRRLYVERNTGRHCQRNACLPGSLPPLPI